MKKTIKVLIIILLIIIVTLLIIRNSKTPIKKEETVVYEKPEERYTTVKEKYECNEFEYVNVSTESLLLSYFNKYKENIVNNVEKAYETLDSEYRQKRFGSIDKYKEYISSNYDNIILATLDTFKVDTSNKEYTQYICTDLNKNYYIFRETAIMQYSLILDTYTIDLPEFLQKYNSTNDQGKVALNIQKFMQAIDSKDYNYAYNCLADGFKQNYFNTVDEFKKYAEENFYSRNLVTYTEFKEEGGLYKYTVNINNANYQEEIKTKTFIVKLNEGTEFEMSFNV